MTDFEVWSLFVGMQSKRKMTMECVLQGWCLGAKDAAGGIALAFTRG